MKAYIYHREDCPKYNKRLTIDGKGISFFVEPILQNSTMLQSSCGNHWTIRFFEKTPFEQKFRIHFDSSDSVPKGYPIAKAIWLDNEDKGTICSQLISAASLFVRESSTLTSNDVHPLTSTRSLITDREAIAYFSGNEKNFRRVVLIQALALAYKQVMYRCMTSLSLSVKTADSEETLNLYEQILRFNAADYFRHPVHLDRHELSITWDLLARHFRLQPTNKEMTEQLSGFSLMLKEQRDQNRLEREKDAARFERERENAHQQRERELEAKRSKAEKRLTFALSVISLLSLLSLAELTPNTFKTFYNDWIVTESISENIHAEADPKGK